MSEESTEEPKEQGAKSLINITATDIFGLGKLANSPAAAQVVAAVSSAFGNLWSPVGGVLKSELEGFERRRQAGLDAQAASEVAALYAENPEIAQITKARILGVEFKRTERIVSATRRAAEIADAHATSAGAKAGSINPDFASEWVEAVKDVSDTDVVEIFASLLASAPETVSGRPPSQVLKLAQQLDGDAARLLRKLMVEWRMALPVPANRLHTQLSDDEGATLLLMEEAGFLVREQSVNILSLDWEVSFHPLRPRGERVQLYRKPINGYRPTETCRRLINLLVSSSPVESLVDEFLINWRQWFPATDTFIVRVGEQAFQIPPEPTTPVITAPPFALHPGGEWKPKLRQWLAQLEHQRLLFEMYYTEDPEVFKGEVHL